MPPRQSAVACGTGQQSEMLRALPIGPVQHSVQCRGVIGAHGTGPDWVEARVPISPWPEVQFLDLTRTARCSAVWLLSPALAVSASVRIASAPGLAGCGLPGSSVISPNRTLWGPPTLHSL